MKAPAPSDEPLILVDEANRALGAAAKQAVHREGLLHRAFSIFMVDARGRILLQQRSPSNTIRAGCGRILRGHRAGGERTVAAARAASQRGARHRRYR
jgi:isopentenyl-diphosphate delta-isomerase